MLRTILLHMYWLLKSEPASYSWQEMCVDMVTSWVGVRNLQARNYILSMQLNDLCFFYHSGSTREIVGIVRVVSAPYLDSTAGSISVSKFYAVDVQYVRSIKRPILLSEIKATADLAHCVLLAQPRLSIVPITNVEWEIICAKENAK